MKFSLATVTALLLTDSAMAFTSAPAVPLRTTTRTTTLSMAMDMPPVTQEMPVIKSSGQGPATVRYSDFLKLVNGDRIEKVTFSADGTQLLGVDADGTRLQIPSLPNDPELLTQLTSHKVRFNPFVCCFCRCIQFSQFLRFLFFLFFKYTALDFFYRLTSRSYRVNPKRVAVWEN